VIPDLEQAIFVKGGTILPLLEHDGCMALLACITNSIELEIYPNVTGASSGEMYIDDGETFDFKKDDQASTLLKFSFYSDSLYL